MQVRSLHCADAVVASVHRGKCPPTRRRYQRRLTTVTRGDDAVRVEADVAVGGGDRREFVPRVAHELPARRVAVLVRLDALARLDVLVEAGLERRQGICAFAHLL